MPPCTPPETLDELERAGKGVLLAIALKIGRTRLIDNMIKSPNGGKGAK